LQDFSLKQTNFLFLIERRSNQRWEEKIMPVGGRLAGKFGNSNSYDDGDLAFFFSIFLFDFSLINFQVAPTATSTRRSSGRAL
jgi:hypothetical protein